MRRASQSTGDVGLRENESERKAEQKVERRPPVRAAAIAAAPGWPEP